MESEFPDGLEGVVSLRMAAYSTLRGFCSTPAASSRMRQWVANGVAQAWSNGGFRGLQTDGVYRAQLYWWHQDAGFHGAPTQNIVLDWLPDDGEAEEVALQYLADAMSEFGDETEIQLLPFQQRAVDYLLSQRFTVLGHILMGESQRALARVVSLLDPPEDLGHLGLSVKPIRRSDVDAILELQHVVFTHAPWACWFGTSTHYIDTVVRPMLEERRESANFCIWRGEKLLGAFGADIERNHPFWGDIAGVDVVLHPSIQKQGIVKTAYRRLLTTLVDRGVDHFKGGTVQPAVFRLAEVMERRTIGLHLHRRDVPKPPTDVGLSSFLRSS